MDFSSSVEQNQVNKNGSALLSKSARAARLRIGWVAILKCLSEALLAQMVPAYDQLIASTRAFSALTALVFQ